MMIIDTLDLYFRWAHVRCREARTHLSGTFRFSRRGEALRIPYDLSTDKRLQHLHIPNFHRVNGEHVVAHDHHIGEFAGGCATPPLTLEIRIRRTPCVCPHPPSPRQPLPGAPT